jgi:proteasome accessory factor B
MRDRLNLPIEYDERRYGYFYSAPVDAFPTLQITEGELLALVVAEKALQQYRGTPFERRLMNAFRKLERSLPDTVSLNLADWNRAISFRTTAEPTEDLAVIDELVRAASGARTLLIAYRKPGGRPPEERVVDPYHVGNVNGDWYLFAHDHLRKDIRTFAAARIASAAPTGDRFKRPASFDLERHLRDSFGVHSRSGDYEVVLRFDAAAADYIREKRWHPSQSLVEAPGGGLEMRLRLGSLVEVRRWILGWAGSVRVVEPPELAAGIREDAAALLAMNPAP